MIETIKNNPKLRKLALWLICPDGHPRPRWWVRTFLTPLRHRHGKGARISRRARLDIFPWHRFTLGAGTRIEDFAVINNGSGDVIFGENNYIGIGSVIVGPVETGACVGIGQHCQIGAGAVVTKDIPPYSVAVGNPARVVKRYDFEKKEWVRV